MMKHCLTAILLVLAITGCNSPTEKPVSEQPQAIEGTPEPALVQTSEPSPEQTPAASPGNCDRAYSRIPRYLRSVAAT